MSFILNWFSFCGKKSQHKVVEEGSNKTGLSLFQKLDKASLQDLLQHIILKSGRLKQNTDLQYINGPYKKDMGKMLTIQYSS